MKSIIISRILFSALLLTFLFPGIAMSQDTKTMEIVFKVRNEDVSAVTPIVGASVSAYEKATNKLIQTRSTPQNGNVKFTFDLYKEYFLTFTKKDFVTKKLLINATVKGKEDKARLLYETEHIVNMYAATSDKLGAELLDKPFDKLIYSTSENNFISDNDYQATIKKELSKLTPQAKADLVNKLKGGGNTDDLNNENKYKEAIANGDKSLSTNEYLKARYAYNQALEVMPNDKYAKDKLKQIEAILKSRNPKDAKYMELLAKADIDLGNKLYDQAKKGYREAGKLKPTEKYPKDKIAEIDQIAFKENSKKYKEVIYRADKLFLEKKYIKAKEAYTEASGISPHEKYPKDKLVEINKLYKDAIFAADKLFLNKELEHAKVAYSKAIALNPAEQYPKDQIKEINRQLNQGYVSIDYGDLIANGDKALKEKNYIKAKTDFTTALKQKPAEKYPREQLSKIDGLIAKDPNFKKETDKKYNEAMKIGKDALDSKDYETSKDAYSEASTLKPEQKMPKTQLAKIEELIKVATKELDDKYKAAIARADKELGQKQYDNAKISFNDASNLKPNENYPKDKLAEIEKLTTLSPTQVRQKYKLAISKGDKAFNEKDYDVAKDAYKEADAIDPTQKYPQERITEIDKLIKEMEKNLNAINKLIGPGNTNLRATANNNQVTQQLQEMHDEQLAKVNQMKLLKKAYAKHMANLSTKYSTLNPLTKLLDIVDSKEESNLTQRK